MYYGPFQAAFKVISLRDPHGMPLLPLIMNVVVACLWTSYGAYLVEIPIIVPNLIGILFALLQISIWFWAWSKPKPKAGPEDLADKKVVPVEIVIPAMPAVAIMTPIQASPTSMAVEDIASSDKDTHEDATTMMLAQV